MPQFAPGESKTAISPITVKPAGLSCEAELFLGPDELTKVTTSGRIPFTSTGASQDVRLPVTMPSEEGAYYTYIDVYAGGVLIAAYQAIEDVVIAAEAPPPIAGSIDPGYIWYEGLASWETFVSGREIPLNSEIHLAPLWINKSAITIVGHVDLSVIYPDGSAANLVGTLNQDKEGTPTHGWYVQFQPFLSSQEGTYIVTATLSSGGQVLASVTFTLVAAPSPILVNPGFEDGSLSPWVFWTNYGGRCTARLLDEDVYEGLYSARFVASTGLTRSVIGTLTQTLDWRDEYRGKAVTFGAMAKGASKNNMSIQIADGVGVSSSPVHSGSSQWQALLVPRVIAVNATKLEVVLKFAPDKSLGTKAKAYFDATFLEGI